MTQRYVGQAVERWSTPTWSRYFSTFCCLFLVFISYSMHVNIDRMFEILAAKPALFVDILFWKSRNEARFIRNKYAEEEKKSKRKYDLGLLIVLFV